VDGLPRQEDVQIVNTGFLFAGTGLGVAEPPPRLGEHADEVLEELGFDVEAR
jgi:formyl-CoA transferase